MKKKKEKKTNYIARLRTHSNREMEMKVQESVYFNHQPVELSYCRISSRIPILMAYML